MRGTLLELRSMAYRLLEMIVDRKALGFFRYHPSARYVWMLGSINPCDECLKMMGHSFSGDEIKTRFPYSMILDDDYLSAEYHRVLGYHSPCYCKLLFVNKLESAEIQLKQDMESVV